MAERPQANTNLGQPEAIRTVARPTSDRAVAYTPKESRAGALAQSLSSIAPQLQGYVQEFGEVYRENESNRAYDEIQGMTFESAQEAVKSGAMRETESPWYQAAFEKQFGTVFAQRRRRELVDRYNNEFDKHNGNLEEFIAEFAGEDVEKFGGSEFIMSGYRNSMGGTLSQLQDQHAEWKSTWTRERVAENFGTMAYDAVTKTVAEGGDINAAINALKGEHREAFGMTFGEMDTNIFGMAERLASEGNVEALEQLLTTEIVGPDGTVVGSYMNRSTYAEKSAMYLEQARAVRGEAAREENTATIVGLQQTAAAGNLDTDLAIEMRDQEQISIGEYERLVKSNSDARMSATLAAQNDQQITAAQTAALKSVVAGQGYAIRDVSVTDANGNTRTISRDKLIQGAVLGSLDEFARRGASTGQMAEQLSSYGVDVKYPAWETLLSDGYLPITEAAAIGEDGLTEIPETTMRAFQTYKGMAETPQLRSRHINNTDAENVWATAVLLEENGYSTEDALMRASKPPTHAASANNFTRAEFEQLSRSVEPGLWGDEMANGAAAIGQTEALAKFFIARGVPKERAVERAIEDYQASHTSINGVSVNTRNIHLPQSFEDASLVVLQDFAELHGEDVDDLTLIPAHDGSNNWTIANKGNVAMPVQIMGADNVIHTSEITRTYQNVQREIAETAYEAAQTAVEAAKTDREYNAGMQEAVKANEQAYREWQNMSRKDRRAAGLPVSKFGGQNHFSRNVAIRRFTEDFEARNSVMDEIESGEMAGTQEAPASIADTPRMEESDLRDFLTGLTK